MRILVSGSRDFLDATKLTTVLDNEHPTLIIHGGARGADSLADDYGKLKGLPVIRMDANWDFYKRAAGPVRNRWMLDLCNPDLVVAFPTKNSRGTRDMIKYAESKGVPTLVIES